MIKLLKVLNKKDWLYAITAMIFIILNIFFELKIPEYMTSITKLASTSGSSINSILQTGYKMIACSIIALILSILSGYFVQTFISIFSKKARRKVFYKVQNMSVAEIKKLKTDSLITRTTNDILQVEMFYAMGLAFLVRAPLTAIWAMIKISNIGFEWSLATIIAVCILLLVVTILIKLVLPKFKIMQELIDKINSVTRETLSGVKVIRAYNAEDYQENKFDKINKKLTKTQTFNQRMFSILNPTIDVVLNELSVTIFIIGAYLIYSQIDFTS